MTEVLLETLLERLQRKLSLPDPDSEELALLADELSDAEGKLLLYLDVDALEERFHGTVVELAALARPGRRAGPLRLRLRHNLAETFLIIKD